MSGLKSCLDILSSCATYQDQLFPVMVGQIDSFAEDPDFRMFVAYLSKTIVIYLKLAAKPLLHINVASSYTILFISFLPMRPMMDAYAVFQFLANQIRNNSKLLMHTLNWIILLLRPTVYNIPGLFFHENVLSANVINVFATTLRNCLYNHHDFEYQGITRSFSSHTSVDPMYAVIPLKGSINLNTSTSSLNRDILLTMIGTLHEQISLVDFKIEDMTESILIPINVLLVYYAKDTLFVQQLLALVFDPVLLRQLHGAYKQGAAEFRAFINALVNCCFVNEHVYSTIVMAIESIQSEDLRPFISIIFKSEIGVRGLEIHWESAYNVIISSRTPTEQNMLTLGLVKDSLICIKAPMPPEIITVSWHFDWIVRLRNILDKKAFSNIRATCDCPLVTEVLYYMHDQLRPDFHLCMLLIQSLQNSCKLAAGQSFAEIEEMFPAFDRSTLNEASINAAKVSHSTWESFHSTMIVFGITSESSCLDGLTADKLYGSYIIDILSRQSESGCAVSLHGLCVNLASTLTSLQICNIHQMILTAGLALESSTPIEKHTSFFYCKSFRQYLQQLARHRMLPASQLSLFQRLSIQDCPKRLI